ncbi:unknown [Bacteroides pectinophilus CAG:437]|uniref:Uncharacterized protein n=1 Tax=Bacteroides pectinophilus CAG:437 TaxID=1263051 RepID=R7AMG2_9FIRM|nr:unknown [Bacteroides pectinophilus CAG:437]
MLITVNNAFTELTKEGINLEQKQLVTVKIV